MVAAFLDIDRAYDMLGKEGLGIKLYDAGIRGRMRNWIREVLSRCTIQVKVGGSYSTHVISPVLINIMIHDMFDDLGDGFGRSLFADATIWRKGQNVECLIKEMQLSVAKSNYVFSGRKRTVVSKGHKLYRSPLEKVKC